MTIWRVGMKVVLVDDNWPSRRMVNFYGLEIPILHEIYTVRSLVIDEDELGFWLSEIDNSGKHPIGMQEVAFYARRFRPLVETKTDISIFEKMLRPSPSKVDDAPLTTPALVSRAQARGALWNEPFAGPRRTRKECLK